MGVTKEQGADREHVEFTDGEFVEHEPPSEDLPAVITKSLTEDVDPLPRLGKPQTTPVDPDRVRWELARLHVYVLVGIVVVGAVGWCRGADLGGWASFTAPVFTLIGVVVAFYFGKTSD